MSGWTRIEPPPVLRAALPEVKAWYRLVQDGRLMVFAGPEPDGFHLSISHTGVTAAQTRYPTWDEIRDARYDFCPADVTMAMLLPPRDQYVNVHDTTFHLWQVPG